MTNAAIVAMHTIGSDLGEKAGCDLITNVAQAN